jgi:hypothetical protein
MRQIEIINDQTIIDINAQTASAEVLVYDYSDELIEQYALQAQQSAQSAQNSAEDASDSADNALQSEQNALQSEQNALQSEQNALASEQASALSASNALQSEQNALQSEQASALSEQNALQSEQNALASEQSASQSASNALQSEQNALASEQSASQSASNALASEQASALSASNALQSEQNALQSEQASSQSASDALQSEQNALASEQASALSEQNALQSEQNALQSEQNALTSEQASALSEQNALTSANNALNSANASALSEQNALTSANNALNSANAAAASAASAAQVGTSTLLTGFSTGANTTILSTDTILGAFQKAQGQINARVSGTGASGQVGFWTGTGTQSGDSKFTFNSSTGLLQLDGDFEFVGAQTLRTSSGVLTLATNGGNGSIFITPNGTGQVIIGNNDTNTQYALLGATVGRRLVFENFINNSRNNAGHRINASDSSGAISLATVGTDRIFIQSNGNIGINTITDAGFRLDVNGTARVQGALSVTTGADVTPLTISGYSLTGSNAQSALSITGTWNTTGTPDAMLMDIVNTASGTAPSANFLHLKIATATMLRIDRLGRIFWGSSDGSNSPCISNGLATTGAITSRGNAIIILGQVRSAVGYDVYQYGGVRTPTSGQNGTLIVAANFEPTSGTGVFNTQSIIPTINQTGGANGITRGLLVNPTLTSAADWRSIEWSNNTGWGLYGVGTALNYLNGNLLLGSTTSTGERLQVTGTARISATADAVPLTISGYSLTGSNAQSALSITGTWNTTGTPTALFVNITDTASNANSLLMDLQTGGVTRFSVNKSGNITANIASANTFASNVVNTTSTAGTFRFFSNTSRNFSPTSGNAVFNNFEISNTINQTGGANGITRGLLVNPTLTSAADWRSIEWSNNTGWGLYGVGTANNYLAGKLGIGSLSLNDVNFRISRNVEGSTGPTSVFVNGQVQSGSTTGAVYFLTQSNVVDSAFTLPELVLYDAVQGTLGANAIVTNQVGFRVRSVFTGATNNYGFQGSIASGTNRFNLYMSGTASNYLRGNLLLNTTTDAGFLLDVNGTARFSNDVTIADTRNIILATGTGTKIGTATSQKLGFWNATPIVQPTTSVAGATRVGGGGTTLTDTDTFDGYTVAQIVKALRNMGALA